MANAYERVKTGWTIACRRSRTSGLEGEWAAREPALDGIGCLDDAVARCQDQRHPAAPHAALSALLVLAGDDDVARLAVVRAMLPGLAGLSARGRHPGGHGGACGDWRSRREMGSSWVWRGPWDCLEDFDDEVVVLAFLQVHRLAGQRLEWPASAVLSRVDRQLRMSEAAFRRRPQHEPLNVEDGVDVYPEAAGPRSGLELILHEVHQAHRAGVVSAREARIVLRDRVFGWATVEIATAEGATVAAVQRARSRALRKLRKELDTTPTPLCVG